MAIERVTNVGPAGIDIAYERLGDPKAPPVLMIMGLGSQLIGWPDAFCAELTERGLHLIRFDNRDVGESSRVKTPYKLTDMAGDAVGLLDALGIERAHVVGASMGGFIAQTIAIEHPRRVRSLTSIMSSTGDRSVGQPHRDALALFGVVPPTTREAVVKRMQDVFRVIGSTGFPVDLEAIGDRAGRSFDRGYDPLAVGRQGLAVVSSPDRTPGLRALAVPALVIHGSADRMVDVSGGRATAAAIPGAELVEIEGMGHDLPRALWPQFATKIAELVKRAEAA
jgi:pimeloyl-ACP methyl ester carboxylesterase